MAVQPSQHFTVTLERGVNFPEYPKIDPRWITHSCQIPGSPAREIPCLWVGPRIQQNLYHIGIGPGCGPMEGGFTFKVSGQQRSTVCQQYGHYF